MSPANILLVEDTEVNLVIATQPLEELGHHVEIANNGAEAVEKVSQAIYDLILMDCFMPVMDGYEATRRIRDFETHNNREPEPIIALTADVSTEIKTKCESAGMDDFLESYMKQTS